MEPFATSGLRVLRRQTYYLSADPLALIGSACLWVKKECVISAIPSDVGETNEETIGGSSHDPTQTVRSDLIPPSRCCISTVGLNEIHHLVVR